MIMTEYRKTYIKRPVVIPLEQNSNKHWDAFKVRLCPSMEDEIIDRRKLLVTSFQQSPTLVLPMFCHLTFWQALVPGYNYIAVLQVA